MRIRRSNPSLLQLRSVVVAAAFLWKLASASQSYFGNGPPGGSTEVCTVDGDCSLIPCLIPPCPSPVCVNGFCEIEPNPPNPECVSDAQCPSGEICNLGICEESTESTPASYRPEEGTLVSGGLNEMMQEHNGSLKNATIFCQNKTDCPMPFLCNFTLGECFLMDEPCSFDASFCGNATTNTSVTVEASPKDDLCPTKESDQACMNDKNYAACLQLVENGCTNIAVLESCPLQFRCLEQETLEDPKDDLCPTKESDQACMNDKNYAACLQLVENGCTNIAVLESCPLQFRCLEQEIPEDVEIVRAAYDGDKETGNQQEEEDLSIQEAPPEVNDYVSGNDRETTFVQSYWLAFLGFVSLILL